MINILASLAEEPTQLGSQRTASQSIILDTGTNTTLSWLIGHFSAVQKLARSAGPVKTKCSKICLDPCEWDLIFALSLVLKVRVFGTRIWPIQVFLALKRKNFF